MVGEDGNVLPPYLRRDDEIVITVGIDVARAAHGNAQAIAGFRAIDAEAIGAVELVDIDDRIEFAFLAKDDVADARFRIVMRIAVRRAHDEIVETVAVDVARAAHRRAKLDAVQRVRDRQAEAVIAVELVEQDICDTAGPAKHDIGVPRRARDVRTDDHIVIAVTVDVACAAQRRTGERSVACDEAVGPIQRGEIE